MGDQLPVNARLVRANNQWGTNKNPTNYSFTLFLAAGIWFVDWNILF